MAAKMKAKPRSKPARKSGGKKGGETMVEFTPTRTLPLTVNGRTIEVHAGAATKVPAEYKAVYDAAS